MKKTVTSLFMLTLCIASTANAKARWGMAGCGVGSLIFEDKPGKVQIFAATTNQYFVQSFSVTTGTSNCETMSSRDEASVFITVNKVALQKDISRGNGETLNSLAKLLKCSNSKQLGSLLQKNYETIFPHKGQSNLAQSIEETIVQDQALRQNCSLYS